MKKAYGKFFFTWLLLAVLLTGCGEGNREGNGKENTTDTESEASQIVFECQDMDGNSVSASIFSESKLTMVNVWATYCNPCLSEMPGLGELAGEYEPEEFRIIGIISDVPEGADTALIDYAAKLIELTDADYTHLLLNQSIYDALLTDVTAVPTTFFVNENGEVVDTVIGAMEKTVWEEKINALLEDS
ncbi:MAG: TlpA family protein disulfide reductase [Acetatifactor sp.]|nr:TlpA family protein disulfide reductase [Acetatifactor sp.]